jgi:ATP-dependent Clp protease ATP-binding subunit ClpA
MFDKFGESAIEVIYDAYRYARRFKSEQIGTDHIITALAADQESLPAMALKETNVDSESLLAELERNLLKGKKKDIAPPEIEYCSNLLEDLKLNFPAKLVIKRAKEMRTFFGHSHVEPEHIFLALLDLRDEPAMKILDELGANVTFMNRRVREMIAAQDAPDFETAGLKQSVIKGFDEFVDERITVLEDIERLSTASDVKLADLPQKSEIAHLVFIAYMPDFLFVQVGYQRYLLEETLKLLKNRAGNLDPEFVASTVSSAAQNLRADVRHTIEYVWNHEFRLLSKFPDEADYDLIGSVIEDLWWTHSEEIALNEVFDDALDDHRRKQMLNLQKRRLEINEKFVKMRTRLSETIRQCFTKRVSA